MSDNGKNNRQLLIEIYHTLNDKGQITGLQWKFHNGVHSDMAEQLFQACAISQMKINIRNQIMQEINKTKIVKPNMPMPNLQGTMK